MVQYVKQYTVEFLLGGFAIAALVLSAELPGMWPGSIPKKASWFLNGSPQCFDELLDRADVDIADNVQDHPKYLIPPEYLNSKNLLGTALEFDYGEQMPKCALKCTRGNPATHIATSFVFTLGATVPTAANLAPSCASGTGVTSRTIPVTTNVAHMQSMCGATGAAATGVTANHPDDNSDIEALFGDNDDADALFGAGYTVACGATTVAVSSQIAANDVVTITVTPTAATTSYYGDDCLADGATGFEFLWNAASQADCTSTMKVNSSWPYGALEIADVAACTGRIAKMPSSGSRHDAMKEWGRTVGGVTRATFSRQRYPDQPTTAAPGATTTAPPKATTLSRKAVQVVANVMHDRDLLSWTFSKVKAQEMNKCPEIIENFRKNTTGFDIYDADDVAEFLACNAIYGFSIAEECVSVLDPRYAHLIDTSAIADFDTEIKLADRAKGIEQCSYKSKAVCNTHRAADDANISPKGIGDYGDASKAPLTATGTAAAIATALKAKSCIVNEFRGRLNYDGGALYNVNDIPVKEGTNLVVGKLSSGKPLVDCKFFTDNGIGAKPKHVCQDGDNTHVIPGGDPAAGASFYKYGMSVAPIDLTTNNEIDGGGPHGVTDYGFSTFGLGALHDSEWQLAYERFVESTIYLAVESEKIDREDDFWDVFPESCFESGATNSGMNNTFIVLYRFFSITLLILIFPRFLIFNCLPAVEGVGGGSLLLIDNEDLMKKVTKRSLWSRLILVFGLFTGVVGVVCAMTLDPAPETALLDQQASWSAFFNNLRSAQYTNGDDEADGGMSRLLFDLSNDNHAGLVLYSDADRTNAYYWSIMSGVVVFLSFFKIASRDVDEDGDVLTGGKLGGGWA